MISILDYGVGNLASVSNALRYLGVECGVISTPAQVQQAGKLILPGVGAFGAAMENLNRLGLTDAILEHSKTHERPILGICLGMQLLLDGSQEDGWHEGLGLLKGQVLSLAEVAGDLVVPHVGWNEVTPKPQSLLVNGPGEHSFYFVHSFYCSLQDPAQEAGISRYAVDFCSVAEYNNVFGCQFHPEKSQRCGLALLRNYAAV
ncbi:MAG: hisH [Planctomycetaceae bacterium]|nr:hisH [Planctomycetaceae bacterium]